MPSREQESSTILSVRLPDELMQRLDRYLDWGETSRRVKSSRHAIIREALSQWLEVHEHEAGLVHLPIARLRQVLPWPRARFDALLEALRAEHQVMLEEGVPGALSASEIHESYHVHGRLYSRLRWCD
jgi:predicted DNA-binding protein